MTGAAARHLARGQAANDRCRAAFDDRPAGTGPRVVALFDAHATARDGPPYDHTGSRYVRFDGGEEPERIVEVVAVPRHPRGGGPDGGESTRAGAATSV